MLRLTPLRETASFQEAFKEEWLEVLIPMIQRKFELSPEMEKAIQHDLQMLEADRLKELIPLLWEINSVEALERWIAAYTPGIKPK